MSNDEKMSIRLPKTDKRIVLEIAAKQKRSYSDVLREAITQYVNAQSDSKKRRELKIA